MYPCPHCDKSFSRPENVIRHAKNHKPVRPHTCRECGKGFSRSDVLAKHQNSHKNANTSPTQRRQAAENSGPDTRKRLRSEYASEIDSPTSQAPVIAANHGAASTPQSGELYSTPYCGTGSDSVGLDSHYSTSPGYPTASTSDPVMSFVRADNELHYFNFLTFSRPWNENLLASSTEWFSGDFYEALGETNYDLGSVNIYQNGLLPSTFGQGPEEPQAPLEPTNLSSQAVNDAQMSLQSTITSGRTSRAPSPPNETSYEDRLPFAWNPKSRQLPASGPIVLEEDDPLFRNHDPEFDISESTRAEIQQFLRCQEEGHEDKAVILPPLRTLNAFIGLFFRHFHPQAPVLHLPTLDCNSLPKPLVSIMAVIGAIYSRLRRTMRFAITALDLVRQNLQRMIERDNNLMREPCIIYASGLVCYAGLWCGNKRAFELAEVLRSAAITYVRRLPKRPAPKSRGVTSQDLKSQWAAWIGLESQKRLQWFIYMLDAQFPTLLNMPTMVSLSEVITWDCPCDEQFWTAPNARRWKNCLGSAPFPPAPNFAAAATPFLWSMERKVAKSSRPIDLNPWSAYLVMLALSIKAFEYANQLYLHSQITMYDSDESIRDESNELAEPALTHASELTFLISFRRSLLGGLQLWESVYGGRLSSQPQTESTEWHFASSSIMLFHLSRLYMNICLTDLQEAIGKHGPENANNAIERLTKRCASSPPEVQKSFQRSSSMAEIKNDDNYAALAGSEAIKLISLVLKMPKGIYGTPLSIICLFISHVALWVLAKTAPTQSKPPIVQMTQLVGLSPGSADQLRGVLELAMATSHHGIKFSEAGLILKHCAVQLTKLGGWGASLNLAVLLQWLSETT